MTESRGRRAAWLAGVRRPGVLRLALVRFAGQFGDGMFQAALGGAILFNPERETDPLAIAGGFTVLLLPYSIIGPYAGALLDRWDRRTVLLVANLLRALLIGVTAVGLLGGIHNLPLELLALAVVGISRFVLAGVSAALPRVLAPQLLVPMNSVLATVASGCAAAGAALAVALIGALGSGNLASAVATGGSAVGSVLGALAAASFGARVLGPDTRGHHPDDTGSVRAIRTGLRTGARAVWESAECTTAMIGVAAHRIVFGADTLIMVLVLRRDRTAGLTLHSGLGGFGVAIAAAASGMLVAAVLAPVLIPRLGRPRTVTAGLAVAVVVQALLVTPVTLAGGPGDRHAYQLLLAGAFLLGLAGQTIKLTGDATLQLDVDDARRGQVFALQDTIFNIAFVLAVGVVALIIPPDGRSVPVALAGAGVYALGVVAVLLNGRRPAPRAESDGPGAARPLPT
ncbi:MFS transporter [Nocardia aurantia]|uniref:Putative MFS-type transporter n=1 Tax=Nocardia aurantia TaxID=2585199 RepID=A0A7K0DQD4_9NOCA|nr:MFS transporter [Nocardia aurantia]MQY27034.1 putative MFS-type transporter [Nocardia aurantia]